MESYERATTPSFLPGLQVSYSDTELHCDFSLEKTDTEVSSGDVSSGTQTFTEPIPEVRLRAGVTLRPRASGKQNFSVVVKDGYYSAYLVPAIDAPLVAHSVKSLKSAVHDALAGLWEEYAEAPDDTLWPDAQALKRCLHECYEVAAE